MRDQDIGFGMKIRVYDYKDLWDLDNIEEAGWAMVHKINYIPDNAMTNWNKYPVRHQIRSCFIHNFKHSLTTIQSKMSVMGANTKWSANSRGEISFV